MADRNNAPIVPAGLRFRTERSLVLYIARHLFKQNRQSRNESRCLYRSPDGLSCAAGCVLPDKYYDARMEPDPLGVIIGQWRLPSYFLKYRKVISSLQNIHDADSNWDTTKRMRHVIEVITKIKLPDTPEYRFVDR